MMPFGNLAKMVAANTTRSPRHFVLSAFGIVIGIATFVVFLASTEQVGAVLEKIFPVEQVQVVAPRASLLGKDISKKLDDAIVQQIKKRPEVDPEDPKAVVPRMNLSFPAFGRGDFESNDLKFEVGASPTASIPSSSPRRGTPEPRRTSRTGTRSPAIRIASRASRRRSPPRTR